MSNLIPFFISLISKYFLCVFYLFNLCTYIHIIKNIYIDIYIYPEAAKLALLHLILSILNRLNLSFQICSVTE